MSALTDYLHMGGYAFYVWGTYGLAALILLGLLLASLRGLRVRERELAQLEQTRPRRRAAKPTAVISDKTNI